MEGHRARVGTMAWSSHMLSSGSRDRAILQRDIRVPEDYTSRLTGHRSEVCPLSLKISPFDLRKGSDIGKLHIGLF